MAFHQCEQADVSLVLNSPQKPEKWKLKEKEIKNKKQIKALLQSCCHHTLISAGYTSDPLEKKAKTATYFNNLTAYF